MTDIGYAHFSEPKDPRGGLCSVGGAVHRFGSPSQLDSSVVWVTNVDTPVFSSAALYKLPQLRGSQFARLSVQQIQRELGLSGRNALTVSATAQVVAGVVQDVEGIFGVNPKECMYRLTKGIHSNVIDERNDDVHCANKPELLDAIEQSTQSNQGSASRPVVGAGARIAYFTFPRATYATYILNQQLPTSCEWREFTLSVSGVSVGTVNGVELPGTKAVLAELKGLHSTGNAAFIRVRVRRLSDLFQNCLAFGAQGATRVQRGWACLPEVIDLLSYAEVEIAGGFISSAGKSPYAPDIDMDSRHYSYVRGLTAENYLIGIAETREGKKGKKYRQMPLGAYIKSYDRLVCGKLAKAMAMQGFVLAGFGVGVVRVWVNDDSHHQARQIALSFGAIPDFASEVSS